MSDRAPKSAPFFSTPAGTVGLAVMCWILSCVLAMVAILVLQILSLPQADRPTQILLTYVLFAPATIAGIFSVVFLIVGSIRWALFGRRARSSTTLDLKRELALLESINQRLLLSETAKKVTYRADDLAVLRRTLEDDIRRGEFNSAMVLVTELANTYGQLEEAESFRSRIEEVRRQDQDEKVTAGVRSFEQHMQEHDFDAASAEAKRLKRLFPSADGVDDLPRRLVAGREQYKHELERAFLQASEREEIDRALDIMTKLDTMLTPEEAEPFREVARGVIGKKRDNLGVQFKLAVHDKEWVAAVAAGEQIIKQFPNTRMADEVRARIDQLRANAAGQQGAYVSDSPRPSQPARETTAPPANSGISFIHTE